jgi:hypothetical protein
MALEGYASESFTYGGKTRVVYRQGTGPAVIVIAEMPGIHPGVVSFADRVAGMGCTAVLPHLFGDDREAASVLAGACRLDGGVEREEVRLAGDRRDCIGDLPDALRLLGEHGKGFAVVAEEVRKLASESARALDTIRTLASEIRAAAITTEERILHMSDRVANGESVIRASALALTQIGKEIEASRSAVERIVEAVEVQRQEAESLSREIEAIAEVAEQNASTSQQVSAVAQQQTAAMSSVAASSSHLAASADRLRSSTGRFDV